MAAALKSYPLFAIKPRQNRNFIFSVLPKNQCTLNEVLNSYEIVTNSYEIENVTSIVTSITIAAASRDPISIVNAVKEVLGPLYSQWPEQIKADFDAARVRSIDIELKLKRNDSEWVIKSEELIYSIENYISDVCNALLPE